MIPQGVRAEGLEDRIGRPAHRCCPFNSLEVKLVSSRFSFASGDTRQFRDNALQFLDDAVGSRGFEDFEQFVEVPELQVATAFEALPDFGADHAVVVEDGAGVVELVGGGDQLDVRRFDREGASR